MIPPAKGTPNLGTIDPEVTALVYWTTQTGLTLFSAGDLVMPRLIFMRNLILPSFPEKCDLFGLHLCGSEGTIYGKLHCFLAEKEKWQILPKCACSHNADIGAGLNHRDAAEHRGLVQSAQLDPNLPLHDSTTKPAPGLQTNR